MKKGIQSWLTDPRFAPVSMLECSSNMRDRNIQKHDVKILKVIPGMKYFSANISLKVPWNHLPSGGYKNDRQRKGVSGFIGIR
jgi:hypothetical protein